MTTEELQDIEELKDEKIKKYNQLNEIDELFKEEEDQLKELTLTSSEKFLII